MKKKKVDSLSLKFDKQRIAQLTSIKGKSIDYACAHGVIGGDYGNYTTGSDGRCCSVSCYSCECTIAFE